MLETTPNYDLFWRFVAERQSIFFKKQRGEVRPWTDDHILHTYMFTNVYRASDRVSQYLIKDVLYSGDQAPEELFFRCVLFRTFSSIETWKRLTEMLGVLSAKTFSVRAYVRACTEILEQGYSLFTSSYGIQGRKFSPYLFMLEDMLTKDVAAKIQHLSLLRDVFDIFYAYTGIGLFFANQYMLDINYSTLCHFSENDVVALGPGARKGLQLCISPSERRSEKEIVRIMVALQDDEFSIRHLCFHSLFGRSLHASDIEHALCEFYKYRVCAHQQAYVYVPDCTRIELFYPPKWKLAL